MADVSWKEKMAERCKQTLPPITDKDLEIETVKIPRPINLGLIKENINCPINIEIDTANINTKKIKNVTQNLNA